MSDAAYIKVRNVVKHFPGGELFKRSAVRAVEGVSFDIGRGETLGLVGESGSGKSTLGRIIVGLESATSGSVTIGGERLATTGGGAARKLWREMQMVFQDPYSSLNPRMTIRDTLAEPLRNFGIARGAKADRLIRETIEACGLSASALSRYPREFSGGQRQRVGIARALILRPKFIVADEPVSALDVSIQAQIVNLMQDLKDEFGLTYLFIAHDLALVRHVSDHLAVMYRGRIVEMGPSREIYAHPLHPYTQLLVRSIPIPDTRLEATRQREVRALRRDDSALPETGCAFAARCPFATELCTQRAPDLKPNAGRQVACHHPAAEFAAVPGASPVIPHPADTVSEKRRSLS